MEKKKLPLNFKESIKNYMKDVKLNLFDIEGTVHTKVKSYLESVSREQGIPIERLHVSISLLNEVIEVKICENEPVYKIKKDVSEIVKFFV